MAMTNAERQAAWRARRESELKRLRVELPPKGAKRPAQFMNQHPRITALESEVEELQNEIRTLLSRCASYDGLLRELEPLIKGLATMSPGTVAGLAAKLRLVLDPVHRAPH